MIFFREIIVSFEDNLNKIVLPSRVYLCDEPWTPQNGMLTEAMKLKRRPIAEKYRKELEAMYDQKINL